MVERLGLVLYWIGCGLAGIALFALGLALTKGNPDEFAIAAMSIFAALCWGVGRACKFVLAGR